ncbi:MAG: hypothetical protein ABI337_01275 [Nitrososphaera sp.]
MIIKTWVGRFCHPRGLLVEAVGENGFFPATNRVDGSRLVV